MRAILSPDLPEQFSPDTPKILPSEFDRSPPLMKLKPALENSMKRTPTIYPLDAKQNIYALVDERGNTIGTGTQEVCEFLLYIVTNADFSKMPNANASVSRRNNVRSAIAI